MLPKRARLAISAALSERTSRRVRQQLSDVAAGGREVVVGPWLGEVGFELLYWIPFLQWAVDIAGLDRSRILVVSRGGVAGWYRHVSDRYADVLDHLSPEEFEARNRERHEEVGEQKQVRPTSLDRDIVSRVSAAFGLRDPHVLHPSAMYDLLRPYWWGHRSSAWVEQHAHFRPFDTAPLVVPPPASIDLPPGYAAVKFYFNECFPATSDNRALATTVVRELSEEGPVISLATGLRVDDHLGWEEEERMTKHGIRTSLTPATNLGVQSAIVAGARAWAGTYGGFAYLAPFYGVPAAAFYSNAAGFSRRHLELAERVFGRFGSGLLRLNASPLNASPRDTSPRLATPARRHA